MIESEGGYLSMNMPLQISPIKKAADEEFRSTEPLFLKNLNNDLGGSQVPRKMTKNNTSMPTLPRGLPGNIRNRALSKVKLKPKMYRSPTPFAEDYEAMLENKEEISVIGSLIYEEPASGDYVLNFYSGKFKQDSV